MISCEWFYDVIGAYLGPVCSREQIKTRCELKGCQIGGRGSRFGIELRDQGRGSNHQAFELKWGRVKSQSRFVTVRWKSLGGRAELKSRIMIRCE